MPLPIDSALFLPILTLLVGALIGSFLSVCVYRIPLGKYEPVNDNVVHRETPASIISPPRSFCPPCGQQLLWWHNIPILSWLLLRGKCHFCATPIPSRYFVLELMTALFALACYLRFGPTPTALLCFVVVCALLVITFIDIDYQIIPDVISYPGIALGLLVGATNQFLATEAEPLFAFPFVDSLVFTHGSLIGIAGGAGVLFAVAWIFLKVRKKDGLGLGDVKLLGMVGALFGIECAWFTIFVGSTLGCIIAIPLAVIGGRGFSSYIPFGPYLVAGALLYVFDGPGVALWLLEGRPLLSWWCLS